MAMPSLNIFKESKIKGGVGDNGSAHDLDGCSLELTVSMFPMDIRRVREYTVVRACMDND